MVHLILYAFCMLLEQNIRCLPVPVSLAVLRCHVTNLLKNKICDRTVAHWIYNCLWMLLERCVMSSYVADGWRYVWSLWGTVLFSLQHCLQ